MLEADAIEGEAAGAPPLSVDIRNLPSGWEPTRRGVFLAQVRGAVDGSPDLLAARTVAEEPVAELSAGSGTKRQSPEKVMRRVKAMVSFRLER